MNTSLVIWLKVNICSPKNVVIIIAGTLAAACLLVAVLFIDTLVSQPCVYLKQLSYTYQTSFMITHIFLSTLHHVMSAPNTVDQSTSLLQQPMATSANTSSGGGRKARVASCYIRQMSEANLLISAEQIQLMDSVGQGQVVATQV